MSVLTEILDWSKDRPAWQRDALRRLVINGDLTDEDIEILTEICKIPYGLSEQQVEASPLSKEHIPDKITGESAVSLDSIFHYRGVNALAENQTLKFSSGLTVVYGDNGAGKTGYIRILKSACRARGQEKILGNVVSGTTPLAPIVAIKYKVGTEPDSREWSGGQEDEYISRVSVFDTQCAAVYLTEKTDVAFRPFGLDLFDKLVKACKSVRVRLESEQRTLNTNALTAVQAQIPEGTAVAKFLTNINSLTNIEVVQELAHLSRDEEERLSLLEKSLLDIKANDPEKMTRQLSLQAGRIQALVNHVKNVEVTLSIDSTNSVFKAKDESHRKSEEAKRLREATFPSDLLTGTGTDQWGALWESARHFSQEQAYIGKMFPVVDDDAYCVLCQQNLDTSAANRLKRFETFVMSTTEQELRHIRENFFQLRKKFNELNTTSEAVEEILKEIRIENEQIADVISIALVANESRRRAIVSALSEGEDHTSEFPNLVSVTREVEALKEQIEGRIKTLKGSVTDEKIKHMTSEALELRARKLLAKFKQTVLDDIERQKKIAAYGLCISDTKANAITQKSSEITKIAVSQRLKQSFRDELENLAFRHVEVELKELGGTDGVFFHKLVLTRAPGVELPKIVSEGEQRCLSIAAFFAELSTAEDASGIVFDDPVSSLDFRWRQGVARRLVQESKLRQIIVFTHDVVFLLLLKQYAEELNVDLLDQHVRQLSIGAGVCADELPWVALPVKKKIGYLKKLWQDADKLSREGHSDAYEKEAKILYGLLREAWERAVEEVLLCGIVERFRQGVQTQQIAKIADISPEDCKAVEIAMSKCSKWLPGHDQAAAARLPMPDSAELKFDIDTLENWIGKIRNRRN